MADFFGDFRSNRLTGAAGNDYILGFDGFDTLFGLMGDDRIFGGNHSDSLYGGGGNDQLDGGAYADLIDGGAGDDLVSYISAATAVTLSLRTATLSAGDAFGDVFIAVERFELSDHADRFFGGDLGERVAGGIGHDTLDGGDGSDSLSGGDGNDMQIGGGGDDSLLGGNGHDFILGNTGNDYLLGESDQDYAPGDDRMYGGAGSDYLDGGSGNDLLDGGSGSDTCLANHGADTMIGGDGRDTMIYDAGNVVNLLDPSQSTGTAVGDVLIGFEALQFRGVEGGMSFTYIGGSQAFAVSNLYASNYMNAYAGSGAERFAGLMTLHYTNMASGITLTGNGSMLVGSRAAAGDVIVNPSFLYLSEHGDIVTGLAAGFHSFDVEFYLNTLGGNDSISFEQLHALARIYTGSGDDRVTGTGGSAAEMSLGTGNDVVLIKDWGDRNHYTGTYDILVEGDAGDDYLRVFASEGVVIKGGVGNDTLVASDVVHTDTVLDLDGGEGDDRIEATSRNVFSSVDLSGGSGNDSLEVRAVNGVVDGGSGNDVLDVTVYKNGYSWSINSHGGQIEVLGGAGNDVIVVSTARIPADYPDPIAEPRGVEIDGGSGNDRITGALATEGASGEIFQFQATWGRDTVAGGFDLGTDFLAFDSGFLTSLADFDRVTGNAGWTLLEDRGMSVLVMGLSVFDVQRDPSAIFLF